MILNNYFNWVYPGVRSGWKNHSLTGKEFGDHKGTPLLTTISYCSEWQAKRRYSTNEKSVVKMLYSYKSFIVSILFMGYLEKINYLELDILGVSIKKKIDLYLARKNLFTLLKKEVGNSSKAFRLCISQIRKIEVCISKEKYITGLSLIKTFEQRLSSPHKIYLSNIVLSMVQNYCNQAQTTIKFLMKPHLQ